MQMRLRDLINSGKSSEEIDAILSGRAFSSDEADEAFPQMAAQPQPMPDPFSQSDRVAMRQDNSEPGVRYGDDLPQNYIRNNSTGNMTSLDQFARPYQGGGVWSNGPQVMREQANEDGTTTRYVKIPSLDSEGRQSSAVVAEKVTPDYLNPLMKKKLDYETAQQQFEKIKAETAKAGRPDGTKSEDERRLAMYNSMPEGDMKRTYGIKSGFVPEAEKDAKPVPAHAATKIITNRDNLRKAQTALSLLSGDSVGTSVGDKEATGWKGYAPDSMLQRLDPQGIDARAALGDIGSMVIHQRSGAAVTASEFPRLKPFIPLTTDDPDTARKKLARFVSEYENLVEDGEAFYRESGYKVPAHDAAKKAASSASGAPPSGKTVVRRVPLKNGKTGVEYSDGSRVQE